MMARKAAFVLVLPALALSACIPPAAPPPGVASPEVAQQDNAAISEPAIPEDPFIAPRYEDVLDQPAIWEMRPVIAEPKDVSGGTHRVSAGETLGSIAQKSGASVTEIATANSLSPPYALSIGQSLLIPASRFHRVTAGETGIAIARAYGLPWADLVALNGLEEPFILKAGQRLKLPPALSSPAAEVAPDAGSAEDPMLARASAFKINLEDILTGGEPAQSDVSGPASDEGVTTRITPPSSKAVVEPARFSGSFNWPVAGRVISRFGPASEGIINQGIEIRTIAAAPVQASSDGVVAFVGNDVVGYGGMILIRHGGGWISAYGRVATAKVRRGQQVKRGDVIGSTGTGTSPQLHFQLRKQRQPVDPLKQLPPRA